MRIPAIHGIEKMKPEYVNRKKRQYKNGVPMVIFLLLIIREKFIVVIGSEESHDFPDKYQGKKTNRRK